MSVGATFALTIALMVFLVVLMLWLNVPIEDEPKGELMNLPDPVKSGISSAILVFLVTFLPALLGWLSDLAEWASSSGHAPLPGISTLGYAAVSAVLAAAGGIAMGLFRWAQGKSSLIPGQPPTFPTKNAE